MKSTGWKRVSKRVPCPICGHGDFCTIAPDGMAVKCMRTPSNRSVPNRDGSVGYLHPTPGTAVKAAKSALKARDSERLSIAKVKEIMKSHRKGLNPERVAEYAKSIGVSVASLEAYGIGYDSMSGSHTFPMYAGDWKPIGIRKRHISGRKGSVLGSRNGLFLPGNLDADKLASSPQPYILFPEGITDCAAAFGLGFIAIGRPSNATGGEFVKQIIHRNPNTMLVIVADADETKLNPQGVPSWPGWEGALLLAAMLLPSHKNLKVIKPPDGAKDMRVWFNAGGTAEQLKDHIAAASMCTHEWLFAPVVCDYFGEMVSGGEQNKVDWLKRRAAEQPRKAA